MYTRCAHVYQSSDSIIKNRVVVTNLDRVQKNVSRSQINVTLGVHYFLYEVWFLNILAITLEQRQLTRHDAYPCPFTILFSDENTRKIWAKSEINTSTKNSRISLPALSHASIWASLRQLELLESSQNVFSTKNYHRFVLQALRNNNGMYSDSWGEMMLFSRYYPAKDLGCIYGISLLY